MCGSLKCACSTCDKKLTCERSKFLGGKFTDRGVFDDNTKTVVSVRDGFMDYRGEEIGMEPVDQIFRVYRSPQSIFELSKVMDGLAVKFDHIDTNPEIGRIESTEVIELKDDERRHGATVALRHSMTAKDEVFDLLASGVREVSLDYRAKMVHNEDSIEQTGIEPDYLAIVESGRCGETCSIKDQGLTEANGMKKLSKLIMKFKDADEGGMTMAMVAEIVAALPEAIKNAPMAAIQELMPALAEVVELAKEKGVDIPEMEAEAETASEDAEGESDEPVEDMESEKEVEDEESEEKEVADMDEDEKEKMADGAVLFSRKHLADANAKAISDHLEVIEHARKFVDEAYSFAGKTANQIMVDVLKKEGHDIEFKDSEINVAFKLLKPRAVSSYQNFGDSNDAFSELANKEI